MVAVNPGYDPHSLDPKQNQRGPHHIEPLNGDEKDPERDGRVRSLGREADTVVTYKHDRALSLKASAQCGLIVRLEHQWGVELVARMEIVGNERLQ